MLRQKANSGMGGVVLYFSDGTNTRNVATDTDGQLLNSDGMTGYFHYRTADLSSYAGKTLTSIAVLSETTSGAGAWLLKFADFVLNSTDGTVSPIYTNETTVSLTQFGTSGVTGVSGGVDHVSNSGDPTNTTWYYHGDQIGSSRLMSANEGWPVWQGTFLPYGEEYNPQITTNHYKFTGKERDSESGLDYFGARYYGNALGRFLTPDWAAKATAVPYANFGNPQTLNLYSYVKNNPTTLGDPDGHSPLWYGGQFWQKVGQFVKDLGVATANFAIDTINNTHESKTNVLHYVVPDIPRIPTGDTPSATTAKVVVAAAPLLIPVGSEASVSKLEANAEALLTKLASKAVEEVGPGSGAVYGTRVHAEFAGAIRALGNPNLSAEVSYLNGRRVDYGTPGSIRVDAVLGPVEKPIAVFDLKTGSAQLTPGRVQQIQSNLPPPASGTSIPVHEVRPPPPQ